MKPLKPIYIADADAVIPQVLKVYRSERCGVLRIDSIQIFDTLEHATRGGSLGCLADDILVSELPSETLTSLHAAIDRHDKAACLNRQLDRELDATLRALWRL
jgi:hypothetical protein